MAQKIEEKTKTAVVIPTLLKKVKRVKVSPKPYDSNQWLLDPRQKNCWDKFIDPKSKTYSNAQASALSAGYSDTHAKQITTEGWWLEKVRRMNMMGKAERNLDEMLDLPSQTPVIGAFGPVIDKKTKKAITAYNPRLLKIKADVSMFVGERLGRDRYGKEGPGEGDIYNIMVFGDVQRTKIAKRVVAGGSAGSTPSQK